MMNDKELKYRKSIEEFIFVAESSTEIICDIVTNELSLNEHYKEKTEGRLRKALEVVFEKGRI